MSLAAYVRILGRGQGRARSFTQDEAREAMTLMLRPDAAPQAVGAILMLMRMKGEIAEEIAGFAEAARADLPETAAPDLDWPCYAAGRTRGLPWFLLSALLVADQGYRVLLHGWNGADTAIRDGLGDLGIPVVTPDTAGAALDRRNIAYLPLEDMHPALFDLLTLRDVLGLRSCVNTVCRMLNPARAGASVQGVFHPSYRLLQADAAELLDLRNLTVIKGGGGEFERHPSKAMAGFGRRDGVFWDEVHPALIDETRRLADDAMTRDAVPGLWRGQLDDPFAQAIVTGTAALAFATLGADDPTALADAAWAARRTDLAA